MSKYDRYERANYDDDFIVGATEQEVEKFNRDTVKIYAKVALIVSIIAFNIFLTVKYFS